MHLHRLSTVRPFCCQGVSFSLRQAMPVLSYKSGQQRAGHQHRRSATMSHTIASLASAPTTVTYEGALRGVTYTEGTYSYEGRTYDTPADEATLVQSVGEALTEPDESLVQGARKLVFGGSATYTSQALLAMATAYESECDGGEGADPVAAVLREAARRVAVIEALTI